MPDKKKTILQILKLKYNDGIIIAVENKIHFIISFVKSQHRVLNESRSNGNQDNWELRLLSTAAEILRKKIISIPYNINPYPASDRMLIEIKKQTVVFFNEIISKDKNKDI